MWLNVFNQMRKDSGMSLDELCAKSGVPKGTLTKITSGVTKAPALETMRSLVYAMGYTLDDLSEDPKVGEQFSKAERTHIKKYRSLDDHGKKIVGLVLEEEHSRMMEERAAKASSQAQPQTAPRDVTEAVTVSPDFITVLLSRQPVSAGKGAYLGPEEMDTIHVVENDITRRASFCVPVRGDSMEPDFFDGQIIIVEGKEDIDIGQIGVFTLNGDGFVKKRGAQELISLNPKYGSVPMNESARCNGHVIGVLDPAWIVND